MPDIEQTVRCSRCHSQVHQCRVQVTGKSLGVVRCNACNTRAVQLYRIPAWSTFSSKLRGLSEEDRAAFWRGTHLATSPEQLTKFVQGQETVVNRHTERQSATVSGEYLPLSVYELRGFDADRIARLCRDTREDPILGTLYRIAIQGKAEQAEDERLREERLTKGSSHGLGGAPSATAPPPEALPPPRRRGRRRCP